MAAFMPFEANVVSSVAGKTISIASSSSGNSIASTLDCTNGFAPSVLVTNQGGNMVWVRMDTEATPTATQTDTPMLPNTVRLFANPVPNGKLGIAIVVSVTTSPNTVWFTPGQGGDA